LRNEPFTSNSDLFVDSEFSEPQHLCIQVLWFCFLIRSVLKLRQIVNPHHPETLSYYL